MKCQKCGKSEVTFHYSSNINGCVTETHLCSECAAESGYDLRQIFNNESIFSNFFGNFFPILNKTDEPIPVTIPVLNHNNEFAFVSRPGISGHTQTNVCDSGCTTGAVADRNVSVDDEMRKRRELYQQMRLAANNEDFEKAAQIRDKIKELEL